MLGGRKRQMARLPQVCVFSLSPHSSESARLLGSENTHNQDTGAMVPLVCLVVLNLADSFENPS